MPYIFSDYLSASALIVSLASVFYAKKQSDLSKITLQNSYINNLSDKHNKYLSALTQINKKHKEEILQLSEAAGNALRDIIDLFDLYDKRPRVRYLRHLVHEASEMIHYAFKGQLGWQSGVNISHQLYGMAHLEDELKPRRKYFEQDAFRHIFERMYHKNPNERLQSKILEDKHFCSVVKEIQERIDGSKKAELLIKTQHILSTFNELLAGVKSKTNESVRYLSELIEENELEHFPLDESPKLYQRLQYTRSKLDILGELYIPKVDEDTADKYYNYVSLSIYICAVLYSIAAFHSWGWRYNSGTL
jgi:hypothetical protein